MLKPNPASKILSFRKPSRRPLTAAMIPLNQPQSLLQKTQRTPTQHTHSSDGSSHPTPFSASENPAKWKMAAHATLSPTTCQELTDPHSPWTDHTFCPDTFTADRALKSTANHPLAYLGIIGFFVLQPRAKVNLEDRKRSNESEGNTPNQCMWSEGNTPNQ